MSLREASRRLRGVLMMLLLLAPRAAAAEGSRSLPLCDQPSDVPGRVLAVVGVPAGGNVVRGVVVARGQLALVHGHAAGVEAAVEGAPGELGGGVLGDGRSWVCPPLTQLVERVQERVQPELTQQRLQVILRMFLVVGV